MPLADGVKFLPGIMVIVARLNDATGDLKDDKGK